MMELASNQDKVGNVLTSGQKLIQNDKVENGLSVKEKRTVSNGMESLNAKWEELRKKSMERQAEYVNELRLCQFT